MSSLPVASSSASTSSGRTFRKSKNRKRFRKAARPLLPAILIDAEGTIERVTPAARRMLEYSERQSVGSYFFSHVHGKNMYRVMQDVAHMACHRQRRASWLLRLRTGKERWRWYRATVHNHLADDGHILIVLDNV